MSPFETAPEFISVDNRQVRPHSPVTKEQMHNKHEVLFPASLVRGKTILDLGCAFGATGHWCLSHGAKKYTGVEVQNTSAEKARELLEKYHAGASEIRQNSIEEYLGDVHETFDIVSALGVLYVFTDYYSILKSICAHARETVIIESMYPFGSKFKEGFSGVEFVEQQDINLADENASLVGRGTRISPDGLQFIMKDFGFESKEGRLRPRPITKSLDVYNAADVLGPRFLLRFTRAGSARINLSQDLASGRVGEKDPWSKYL